DDAAIVVWEVGDFTCTEVVNQGRLTFKGVDERLDRIDQGKIVVALPPPLVGEVTEWSLLVVRRADAAPIFIDKIATPLLLGHDVVSVGVPVFLDGMTVDIRVARSTDCLRSLPTRSAG